MKGLVDWNILLKCNRMSSVKIHLFTVFFTCTYNLTPGVSRFFQVTCQIRTVKKRTVP